MSGLLDLSAFRATPVVRDPFDHLVVRGLVVADARAAVLDDFPAFTETGNVPVTALSYGSSFRALVDELQSPALNEIMSEKFGMDLLACPMLVTVRGRSGRDDGFVHTDAWWKLATLLVYLNDDWSAPGGCLRLLRSPDLDDCAVEVPPAWGTAVMFRRSERSYHGHLPHAGVRRVVQINWVDSAARCQRETRRLRRAFVFRRMVPTMTSRAIVKAVRDRWTS